MKQDGYSGTIDLGGLERRLARCAAMDKDFPGDLDWCARATVRDCVCPCMATEESICNALSSAVSESMFASGFCR